MRRAFLLLALSVACSKAETAKTDSAAMAPAPAAMLADADLAGAWAGTTMPMNSDSVLMRWTEDCGAGSCKGTVVGTKDTIPSTYTIMGDSAMGVTQPYTEPSMPGGKVIDSWTLHLKDGKVVGTGHFNMADKPDSVLQRYRFEGSRKP